MRRGSEGRNLKSSLGHSTRVGSHHFSPPAALGTAGGFFFFSCACCCSAACNMPDNMDKCALEAVEVHHKQDSHFSAAFQRHILAADQVFSQQLGPADIQLR